MKFNGDGFITTNAVLLSIISFSIASAYPSILSKLKEERKAGSTAKEEQKSLGFKQRMHGFGLDHTNTTLGKARLRESVLGANGRRMPVFRSDIAQYDTNILFNDSKVSEARVTHLIPKIPNYASQYISQPDIAGTEPKLFDNRYILLHIPPILEKIPMESKEITPRPPQFIPIPVAPIPKIPVQYQEI